VLSLGAAVAAAGLDKASPVNLVVYGQPALQLVVEDEVHWSFELETTLNERCSRRLCCLWLLSAYN
jgi:hypothetical protein